MYSEVGEPASTGPCTPELSKSSRCLPRSSKRVWHSSRVRISPDAVAHGSQVVCSSHQMRSRQVLLQLLCSVPTGGMRQLDASACEPHSSPPASATAPVAHDCAEEAVLLPPKQTDTAGVSYGGLPASHLNMSR